MMNLSTIVGVGMIFIGVIYLISTKHKSHINNPLENNIKYDEELFILDNIIYKIKLKDKSKSIDVVIENLKNHNIKINFNFDFDNKNK